MKKIILLVSVVSMGFFAFTTYDNGKYFEIAKNLEIFTNVYKEINHSYVDELEPSKLMKVALTSMMEGLDPFTNYISETDIEGYRIMTEGRYNGLGADSKKMGDYVTITQIYKYSAADKAGLKVGDQVLIIDGQDAKGREVEQIQEILKGFPGTTVDMTVRRPGESKDIKLSLKREEVNVPNVPYSGIVAPGVGYVNLTVYTQQASDNVKKALKELQIEDPNLKGLILDLRGNGGGLLAEAVNLVNLFVPKNLMIVSTKGKVQEWDREFKTLNNPVDENLKVVVLVDAGSASASEITCGAIQDLDRGVVMGQLTYGKGLVQNTREVGYNARIKLTTAKYYIPSGRCIQAVRYKDGEPVHIPDEERAKFKTKSGRTVLDGGGVKPDVLLPAEEPEAAVKALLDQNIIFDYCTQFALKNPMDSLELFEFTDWAGFSSFVASKNFEYETETEKAMKTLLEKAKEDRFAGLDTDITALQRKIDTEKSTAVERNKQRIIREIEMELAGRFHYQKGKVKMKLRNDPEVDAAVALLNDPARYAKILK